MTDRADPLGFVLPGADLASLTTPVGRETHRSPSFCYRVDADGGVRAWEPPAVSQYGRYTSGGHMTQQPDGVHVTGSARPSANDRILAAGLWVCVATCVCAAVGLAFAVWWGSLIMAALAVVLGAAALAARRSDARRAPLQADRVLRKLADELYGRGSELSERRDLT